MPPCIMSSQFASHFEPQDIFFNNCYPFGSGMAKILSSESVSSTPGKSTVGKSTVLGHMAQVTMVWLRRVLYFWQHFPTNLKVILMGIARRALPFIEKIKYFKKAGERKINENSTEKKIGKGSCLEYHSLKSLKYYLSGESLVMDHYFGESIEPFINSSNITVNNIYFEGISELCSRRSTIVFDLGNNWEGCSGKDTGCVTIKSPGHVPAKLLEATGTYHHEIFTKGLDFCGYLEQTLDCFNPSRKLNFDKGLGQILESTVVPQELEKNIKSNQNPVIFEGQSLTSSLDSSKDKKQPEMNRKNRENEDTYNMESPTTPNSFQSPLVLSLFYSPLEEEDDNDEYSSEDWWSEDEMEENSQAKTYSDGNNSGEVENCLEVEDDDSVHPVFQNLCGALSMKSYPCHPLCFSKSIQMLKDHTTASLKPKNHQKTVVSSYLAKTNSKLEELCHLPKQSYPREDQKVASKQETHSCQSSPRKNISPVPVEIPLVPQQEIQVKKAVQFSPVVTVHSLVVWDYASRAARRGPWEEMARDRCRFHRRIAQVAAILEPCLAADHRVNVWKRIHGVPQEAVDMLFCSSSARKEDLGLQS